MVYFFFLLLNFIMKSENILFGGRSWIFKIEIIKKKKKHKIVPWVYNYSYSVYMMM